MIEPVIAGALNRAFSRAPGARDALSRQAGKTLALDLVLFRVHLHIEDDGTMRSQTAATPDAIIHVGPDLVSRLPFQGRAAFREARTDGDAELLSAFNDAFQQLDLDAEAELSRLLGPVAGFRLAESGRSITQWLQQSATDTARTFAEYAVEESPMLAGRLDVDRFVREVDTLRDDAARLEARLALLEAGPEKMA